MRSAIVVTGSLNMDFVVTVPHLPAPGETVLGGDFHMVPGGKGANQAAAAARIGGDRLRVHMIGRVGYDLFADHLKASLSAAGVDVSTVHGTEGVATGVAQIWVDRTGQNAIVVAPGANHRLRPQEMHAFRPLFQQAACALFQLEIPLDTVAAGLALAREQGTTTILDPAPAQPLPRETLELVDLLTPNESEACILLGLPPQRLDRQAAEDAGRRLLQLGPRQILLKLGDAGCLLVSSEQVIYSPAFPVEARDATAAGDTFNGALAVALAEGKPLEEALRFANAAAALSVTRLGAQMSIPSREEVDRFLESRTAGRG